MKLLVSIHDVSPANEVNVRDSWKICRSRGITPALLVVPNWHGRWPLARSPKFVGWLRARAADGAEIFLHGERHDEAGSRRTLRDEIRAFGMTASEGEFLSLTTREARDRIIRGVGALRHSGLEPVGFVPPAWLGRPGWTRAVSDSGLRYSEDVAFVYLHERATRLHAPVIRWSARTPFRARLSSLVAAARWRRERRTPLVRLALHPQDLTSPEVRESIVRTLDRWLDHHRPWQYTTL
jgi:predicted deacetylase